MTTVCLPFFNASGLSTVTLTSPYKRNESGSELLSCARVSLIHKIMTAAMIKILPVLVIHSKNTIIKVFKLKIHSPLTG
jgi:hypothetical protein